MWKDMDYYNRRDDDSAIGDSPSHSAEEESLSSRRKSEASDDVSDTSLETHSNLHSKLQMKIPNCLLKNGEKNADDKHLKARRTDFSADHAPVNSKSAVKKSAGKNKSNKDDLQLQLQYLLGEMRNLRELDRDILQKFVNLNDCIEEVRWRLAENEAKFQRKLAEDDADEDFFSTLTESRLDEWNEAEATSPKEGNDAAKPFFRQLSSKSITSSQTISSPQVNPIPRRLSTKKAESAPKNSQDKSESVTLKSSKRVDSSIGTPKNTPSSSERPVLKPNEAKANPPVQLEKISDNNYYRFKSPQSSPSDVWVAREKERSQSQVARRRSVKESNSTDQTRSNRPVRSASMLAKKYNDLIQKQTTSSPSNPSDPAKTSRRVQWPITEKRGDVKVSDFQKQREYQNLIGLSRVKGMGQLFTPSDQQSTPSKEMRPSRSSSTLQSINSVSRSNSTRWNRNMTSDSRDGSKRNPKNSQNNNNNSNNSNNNLMIINNYCKQAASLNLTKVVMSRQADVMALTRRGASPNTMYHWIQQQQDDVVASYS